MKKQFKEYNEAELKRLQKLELEILKDFLKICEEHGLSYFGFAGTGIGALRHGGFIPWDDDIDVGLLREDFEKLVHCVEEEMGEKYVIVDAKRYPGYPLMTTRMVLRGTKFREEPLKNVKAPLGIFLDLYPYDKVSDDAGEARRQMMDAWFWSKILILRSIPFPVLKFAGLGGKLVHGICGLTHLLLKGLRVSPSWIYERAYEAQTRFRGREKTRVVGFLCSTYPQANTYRVRDIFPLQKLPFEDVTLNFPRDLEGNLTKVFGDYRKLPPVEKRKNHYPAELEFPKKEEAGDEK